MEFIVYIAGIVAVVALAVSRRPRPPARGGLVAPPPGNYYTGPVCISPNECIIRQDMTCARGEDPLHNPDDMMPGEPRFWHCDRYTGLQPTPEQAREWRKDRLDEINRGAT